MKKFITFLFVSTILFACQKKNPPLPTVVGIWKGNFFDIGNTTPYPSIYRFYTDGSISYFQGEDTIAGAKYTGIYVVKNNRVTIGYSRVGNSNLTYIEEAVLNEKFTEFSGTWGAGTSATDGGTVEATKQ
jgi:hypothetical protein